MPSKVIDQFQSDSQRIATGATAVAEEVGASLTKLFAPYLEDGESGVDWALAQKLISRVVESRSEDLEDIDQQLEIERAANKSLRGERNSVARALRSELRAARFLMDEIFDEGLSTSTFTRRLISQVKPGALARLARETAAALRSPEVAPKRAVATGAFPEPAALANALENRAGELEQLLVRLAPKRKLETLGVGAKNQQLQEANDSRLRSQDLLYGIYRGAGYDHLAARLRPKRARRGNGVEAMNEQEGGASMGVGLASAVEA